MEGTRAAQILRALLPYLRGRSAVYERLVAGLAGAAERGFDGGAVGRLLAAEGPSSPHEARLLLLAALHHAALEDPDLPHAAWFPTAVGREEARGPEDGALGAQALAYVVDHEDEVAAFLASQRLQTNEVGRCAALLPGLLTAASFGLPLRLHELGASAGLNLRFDRYGYRYQNGPSWGPEGGPVLRTRAEGAVPRSLTPPTVEVVVRRGVDLNPIDPGTADGQRLLRSFAWPDEHDRHERLTAAITVARSTPAHLEQGDLVTWAAEAVTPEAGTVTVIQHSQVRHLLDRDTITRLSSVIEGCLRSATPDAPVVALAYEAPPAPPGEVSYPELTVGVGTGEGPPAWSTPVTGDWHGRWVRWL